MSLYRIFSYFIKAITCGHTNETLETILKTTNTIQLKHHSFAWHKFDTENITNYNNLDTETITHYNNIMTKATLNGRNNYLCFAG